MRKGVKKYYDLDHLIVIKIYDNQKMVDLERFTYGIFTFTVNKGYLYVFV